MEYAPDGDLTKVIKKWQMMRRPMPEDLIWKYFIQIARGLHALHSMRILHRGAWATWQSICIICIMLHAAQQQQGSAMRDRVGSA